MFYVTQSASSVHGWTAALAAGEHHNMCALTPKSAAQQHACANMSMWLQEGKVYTFDELSDSSSALISQRHSEMRDAGKEIGKLLSSSNRVLKVKLVYQYQQPWSLL